MEYTIFSESTVSYILRNNNTDQYICFRNGLLSSTNKLLESSTFSSIQEVEAIKHFIENNYSLNNLEIRKVKMIDIGGTDEK